MRLFYKMGIALTAAAALPIGTAGFALTARNERAIEAAVEARFDQTARHAADAVATDIEGRARQLAQTAELIRWNELTSEEAGAALHLLRKQAHAAQASFYPDGAARQIRDADPSARVRAGCVPGAALDAEGPRARALREGAGAVVFSTPYRACDTGETVAVALAVPGGVIALAVPFDEVARRLSEIRGPDPLALVLVDGAGQRLAAAPSAAAAVAPVVAAARAGYAGAARRFVAEEGTIIAAFAPVGSLGWFVMAHEDAAGAFFAAHAMRRFTLLWAGLAALAALLGAALLARRLAGGLERLAEAARALGRGELATRVDLAPSDELGALAGSFNTMASELFASRAEILKWNRELESRVEARTRELREAQAQLVQAQKLAALGQLGAGVAHEINNPLAAVLGHVQLLIAARPADAGDAEALRCIEEGASRASEIVSNLLRFSVQHKDPVRAPVDLNALVRETLSLVESTLSEGAIALELALDPTDPRALADGGQLAQVLLNLVQNARTAMAKGGRLTLRTKGDGSRVALTVTDTGHGIAPEIRERIFEPFFTTKDDWSNVGLGLSVSYRIVADHGGTIAVDSAPGQGSTFTVYLPA